MFITAFIAQGLLTSLMLIAALPPLVTSWPATKMPISAGILNLCIFGAVAVGPTIGALQAAAGSWRLLFWGVAAVAGVALLFSVLTFPDTPPQDPSTPWDIVALGLGITGCGAAFYGAGALQAGMSADARSLVPLIVGVALIVFLVVYEYRLPNPLVPVKALTTSVPLAGLFAALAASAAAFGAMVLLLGVLRTVGKPITTALVFLPEFIAAIAVAGLFAALFRTRFTPLLTAGGLLMVVASAALLVVALPAIGPALAGATGLIGLGVAAAVSPALFLVGLSLRAKSIRYPPCALDLSRHRRRRDRRRSRALPVRPSTPGSAGPGTLAGARGTRMGIPTPAQRPATQAAVSVGRTDVLSPEPPGGAAAVQSCLSRKSSVTAAKSGESAMS
ncbi:MFS transporter [Micromonospora sp. SL4-19]|uniref:MFS transporter n=1 Tax=Micromonospora sp. SL4-19 TaxID=3399129 RepID=UPI003A4D91EB